ncbi:MAG: response regulator, partial [Chloroflexi bacterium]|nr:response regulator [Chloroflexota bacterium]
MTKILVIEDNETIREEVLTWLSLEDYEVVGAANGRKGVEVAIEQLPDLIVSDIMMPDKDGYRVLLELRTQPATALIPFIFLTAKQEKDDVRHGMELGADDYITKPFGREELLRAIETRLNRRNLVEKYSDQKGQDLRRHLIHMLPHELRTPLVGIMGIGELLHQEAHFLTPDEIIEYAELITVSGERLYRLIENHLLYAQLEIYAADPQQAGMAEDVALEQTVPVIRATSEKIAQTYNRTDDLQLDLQLGSVRMP